MSDRIVLRDGVRKINLRTRKYINNFKEASKNFIKKYSNIIIYEILYYITIKI